MSSLKFNWPDIRNGLCSRAVVIAPLCLARRLFCRVATMPRIWLRLFLLLLLTQILCRWCLLSGVPATFFWIFGWLLPFLPSVLFVRFLFALLGCVAFPFFEYCNVLLRFHRLVA